MVDRIRQLLQARQLSPTQFADTIGVARPIVSHILGGRNKPSLEVVQKIIAAFPDVALPWLLSGQGDMLTAPAAPVSNPGSASADATVPTNPPRASRRPLRSAEEPPKVPQPAPVPPTAEPAPAPEPLAPLQPAEPTLVAPLAAAPKVAPNSALDPAVAPLLMTSAKSIRRVLIFYSDGTFADFSPSQDGF